MGQFSTASANVLFLSLTSATVFGFIARHPPSLPRTTIKATSTALLSVLVTIQGQSWILASALALGSVGDAFLSYHGDSNFLYGLFSFLIAHILYIVLFLQVGGGIEQASSEHWRIGLAFAMLMVAPGINVIMRPRVSQRLRVPVLVYSATILCMFLSVLAVENHLVVVGALLFTMSDSMLATDKFLLEKASPHRAWMQYSVWILYYSGQLLIALGLNE